ncbi:protein PHR1-LIKE 3-like [Rhododendron vialii]|uniref:protein PHR1-LIKE 3-like n=1 Tax=Rhododendron vialii TaxID=182163 RepID=UPI00265D7CB2|nr:protein PHR1-LIKE 3-like [Rhododendron vialii]
MYSAIHSLAMDGSVGVHGEFRGSMDGTHLTGDPCLVLSTDPKPRLRWTAELHDRFVDAVAQLGGPDKATPKTIMRTMGVKGLTLYHLKSHLQKYRLGKLSCKDLTENSKDVSCIAESQDTGSSTPTSSKLAQDLNDGYQVTEALRVQMEVQRRLHEQLEVQQRLQLRIEAQSKYLQSILEKACNALNDHAAATSGLEAARDELSELAIKVSHSCNGLDPFDTPKIPSLSELATSLENRISSDLPARFGHCNGSPFSPTGEAAILKKRPRPLFGNGDLVPLEGRIGQVEWMMSNMG